MQRISIGKCTNILLWILVESVKAKIHYTSFPVASPP